MSEKIELPEEDGWLVEPIAEEVDSNENRTFECADCNAPLTMDDVQFGELSEKPLCQDDYDSDLEYASTLVEFSNEGKKTVIFSEHRGVEPEYGDSPSSWFTGLFATWTGRHYESLDAWRGSYNSEKGFEDISLIASGWTTGWTDETTERKAKFNAFIGGIEEGIFDTPCPLYVLIEPTSNVFSQSVVLFVKKSDEETIKNWLNDLEMTVDELKFALS